MWLPASNRQWARAMAPSETIQRRFHASAFVHECARPLAPRHSTGFSAFTSFNCTVCDNNNGTCTVPNTTKLFAVEHQRDPFQEKPYQGTATRPQLQNVHY
jgi:hypothetical protein